jgi:hypothetical protein
MNTNVNWRVVGVVIVLIVLGSFVRITPMSLEGIVIGSAEKQAFVTEAENWFGQPLKEETMMAMQDKGSFKYLMISRIKGESVPLFTIRNYRVELTPIWNPQEKTIMIRYPGVINLMKGWFKS